MPAYNPHFIRQLTPASDSLGTAIAAAKIEPVVSLNAEIVSALNGDIVMGHSSE